jgi:DNA processing protein
VASQLTQRQARLVISIAGEPGDERVGRAVAEFGAIEAVQIWQRGIGAKAMINSITQVLESRAIEQAVKSLNSVQGRFITPQDAEWPVALDDLDLATPVGLWCVGSGDLGELANRSLAIVGARAATAYGERVATDIAAQAAQESVTVVSGAAYGIDAAAHRGVLLAAGKTIAVLACGVDVAYPVSHRGLLTRISEGGVVVSEAPPGAKPHKHRFLIRNRLIAALAQGTLVVEAALRSGSLSTSNWAHTLGREVWGIPGPITSASSAGVHTAIRNNVMTLAASSQDIFSGYKIQEQAAQLGLIDGAIIGELELGPKDTHGIFQALIQLLGTNLDFYELQAALALLEVRQVISLTTNGWQLR